ncbi:MAG: VOC family protein [Candidatus Bathyarchaeota archaeon]|nr:VOC family protein [Candidatus Bathyarchaeota archaeon]
MAKLDHIGVYISNLEKSIKFYEEMFGFKVINRFMSGEAKIATLDMGGGLLELVQRPGSPGTPPVGNWSHLAIYEPKFNETVAKIDSKGIEKRLITQANGNRLCFFNDPDGHTIEIMENGFL